MTPPSGTVLKAPYSGGRGLGCGGGDDGGVKVGGGEGDGVRYGKKKEMEMTTEHLQMTIN